MKNPIFRLKIAVFSPFRIRYAQAFAHLVQGILRRDLLRKQFSEEIFTASRIDGILLVGVLIVGFSILFFSGCASHLPNQSAQKKDQFLADDIIPSGRSLFLFDFVKSQYRKWPMPIPPLIASPTYAIAAPNPSFKAMAVLAGPNGDFFLLDRVGRTLALFDTNAQFLGVSALPVEMRNRNLERLEIFWNSDGQFSFLDLGEGRVYQYANIRSLGSSDEWQLRNTVILPMGIRTCYWEPYFKNPHCLVAGKGWIDFDRYFNSSLRPDPIQSSNLAPDSPSIQNNQSLRAGFSLHSDSRLFFPTLNPSLKFYLDLKEGGFYSVISDTITHITNSNSNEISSKP